METLRSERGVWVFLILVGVCVSIAVGDATTQPAVVHLNQEQDHQRMLGLLHLTALRAGVEIYHALKKVLHKAKLSTAVPFNPPESGRCGTRTQVPRPS